MLKVPQYSITVTVRQQSQSDDFAKLGVKTVVASLDDTQILQKLASEADSTFAIDVHHGMDIDPFLPVVIDTASSAHIPSVEAFLAGLAQRKQATGNETHYTHASQFR